MFTQSPRLAFLRKLVAEHADLSLDRTDFGRVFGALDAYCKEHFPTEERGGWFSPLYLGGIPIRHTPPHLVYAVFAIYLDLMKGPLEPVPFRARPLDMSGTLAIQIDPSEGFLVESIDGVAAPMTDILFVIPLTMPEAWTSDLYGLPKLHEEIVRIACHAAAVSCPTALTSAHLLLHPASKRVLSPLADFTESEKALFFAEPVNESRLERHRERLFESFGTPADVFFRNHDHVKRVLEACLADQP
ncbi:hypothetical protein [Geothrix limicola]|uniref:hypothetical protein n=1 Tax=Geothrix limicola TaxID=2927978 RepID=UPI002554A873|nr:hypothetical protein [Geothrix limicola]